MHELSVVLHVAQMVEDVAKKNNVKRVRKVVLEVGEVSLIVNADLQDFWKWKCSKIPVLNDCILETVNLPAVSVCEMCNKEYSTLEFAKVCPYCKSMNTHLVRGREINLKEIIVDDD